MVKVENKKNRDISLDVIRGIAICLVTLGHCIQYGAGIQFLVNGLYANNWLFQFIYGFHMPLFILISGYLYFSQTETKTTKVLVLNLGKRLLIPIFCWSLADQIVRSFLGNERWSGIKSFGMGFVEFFLMNLWFLWALFYCSLIVIIVNRIFHDKIIAYCGIVFIFFLLPDTYNFYLYKRMSIFFIVGYLFSKRRKYFEKLFLKVEWKWIFLLHFVLYSSLLVIRNYFMGDISDSGAELCFYILGFTGSFFCISGVKWLLCSRLIVNGNKISLLVYIGSNTMGIYVLGSWVFEIMRRVTANFALNYGIILIEFVVVISISLIITRFLKLFKVTNLLLLGGR